MSGEERTHHWLLTSPGPAGAVDEAGDGGDDDGPDFPHHQHLTSTTPHEVPDEGLMSSPVNSEDLDRDSPLGGGMDDDDDDAGPPSIETQAPDHGDDLEVAGITSSWISSGGHYGGSHSCLGYSTLESALPDPADSSGLNEMPGLELGDFGVAPAVYGPLPFNSPVHESSPMSYGDVTDENAIGGICGLSNLGNTCFMAAGIQCLVNTPPIAQYFFSNWHDGTEAQDTLAGRFSQLTHKIWCGRYSSLRPTDFKHTFGQHWRDFRDYRQHDCQEFVTLLLEGLRKQMCAIEMNGRTGNNLVSSSLRQDEGECRTGSDIRNEQGTLNSSGGIPGHSSPPSSIQSPHCPASPQSPHSLKQPLEIRTDHHEESVGLDSGAASPKSSVSSSSMDAHLVNLRLQPIPEEVLALAPSHRMNTSLDDLSQIGTSCHDAESVTSDLSDPAEVMAGGVSGSSSSNSGGGAGGRRYNVLGSSTDLCDSSDCDTSNNLIPHHKLLHYSAPAHCDSSTSSFTYVEKNVEQLKRNEKNEALALSSSITGSCISTSNSHLSLVKIEDIMKETKTSNVNVLVKDNLPNNELLFDSEKYAKSDKTKLQNSVDNLSKSGQKRVKEVNLIHDKKRLSAYVNR